MRTATANGIGRGRPGAAAVHALDAWLELHLGEDRPVLRIFAIFCGIVALGSLAPAVGPLLFALLAAHALRGSRQIIEAYLFLSFLLLVHPAYSPEGATTFRWLVILPSFLRVLWDSRGRGGSSIPPVAALLCLFVLFEMPIAVLSSQLPSLSLFKLISFGIGTITIYTAFDRTRHLAAHWRRWMMTYFVFVILASGAVFLMGTGYARTPQGFQGMLGHPQMFGAFMAVGASWLTSQALLRSPTLMMGAFALSGWLLVHASASRTAALAAGAGFLIAGGQSLFRRMQARHSPHAKRIALVVFLGLAAVVVVGAERVGGAVLDFIVKDDEPAAGGNLFVLARGEQMAVSLENFSKEPLWGIGFGTPSVLADVNNRSQEAYGILVGASSEKGFLPTAVLEETGIFGAVFIAILLIAMALPVHRRGSFGVIWIFWAALLKNTGDAVFLSLGGFGLLMWLWVGFAYNQATAEDLPPAGAAPAR